MILMVTRNVIAAVVKSWATSFYSGIMQIGSKGNRNVYENTVYNAKNTHLSFTQGGHGGPIPISYMSLFVR